MLTLSNNNTNKHKTCLIKYTSIYTGFIRKMHIKKILEILARNTPPPENVSSAATAVSKFDSQNGAGSTPEKKEADEISISKNTVKNDPPTTVNEVPYDQLNNPHSDPNAVKTLPKSQYYAEKNIVSFDYSGQAKLTPEARELYISQVKPKLKLAEPIPEIKDSEEETLLPNIKLSLEPMNENENIAGTLAVADSTEILSGPQSHIVIGVPDPKDDSKIIVDTHFTSEKGTGSGTAGCNTTTQITSVKEFSGDKGAQYAVAIVPPFSVDRTDLKIHKEATAYSNKPEVAKKLESLRNVSRRYEPVPYNQEGITMEDLDRLDELMPIYNKQTNIPNSNENKEEKIKDIPVEKPNEIISYPDEVD